MALLLEDADDPEIAELAGFDGHVSAWRTDSLIETLYDKHSVPAPDDDGAVECLAGLMAADLRARPALVTQPMIRMLATLAPPRFASRLANRCYGAEEYLDCGCTGHGGDPALEDELEALPGPPVIDSVARVLAGPLRSTLPMVQSPDAH